MIAPREGEEEKMFSRNKAIIGMSIASVALWAALTMAPAPASADDASLKVTPAVLQTGDSTAPQATVRQVRWGRGGWGGGGWGRGWGGGYRGYGWGGGYRGWGYGGFYRRPYFGGYPYGYGYGYPGYGYAYGYPGYGYGGYGYGGGYW